MKSWKLKLFLLCHIFVSTLKVAKEVIVGELRLKLSCPPSVSPITGIKTMSQPNTIQRFSVHNLIGLIEIPVERIMEAAQVTGGAPNNFHLLLMTAQAYQDMGVEPVFLTNKKQDAIRVAARELYENPRLLN